MLIQRSALTIFVLLVVSGAWRAATAQETDPTVEFTMGDQEQEPRYEFMAHGITSNGRYQEVYLKLDRWTGRTWRFHASTPRWTPIAEPTKGNPRDASRQSRYELLAHDFYDTGGVEQELVLRADILSGYTWSYRGLTGRWRDIPQEE